MKQLNMDFTDIEARIAPYTCKYCGLPSWVDPSDQTPPPDYCHDIDHGTEEDRAAYSLVYAQYDMLTATGRVLKTPFQVNKDTWFKLFTATGLPRVVGKHPALAAPYGGAVPREIPTLGSLMAATKDANQFVKVGHTGPKKSRW